MVRSLLNRLRGSIQNKLFLILAALIAIPTVLFGIISYWISANSVEKDFIHYKSQLIKKVSESLDENFKNMMRQSMAVYSNASDIASLLDPATPANYSKYMDSIERVSLIFQGILQSNDKIDGIGILTLNGEVRSYVHRRGGYLNALNVNDQAWFWRTKDLHGFPLLREPHYNEFVDDKAASKVRSISVSRLFLDLNSSKNVPLGVLIIDQESSRLQNFLSDLQTENNETDIVLGSSGDILYTNHKLAPKDSERLSALLAQMPDSTFDFTLNGDRMLAIHYESEEYHWKIVSLLPYTELRKKSQFLKNINVTLLILIIVLAFPASVALSYLVTNPLKKLIQSFHKIKRGDFNTQIIVRGNDEISQIGTTFNAMVSSINQLIKQKYEMEITNKQAQLTVLHNQVNPHFLFNTLNSIKAVIEKKDNAQASHIVQNLSEIFRYSMSKGNHLVKLEDELRHINNYLFIQQCRFPDKLNVLYDIDEETLDCPIPRLTLQPVVENALFHGIEPLSGKGELRVAAKTFGENLNIYITDTGCGIPAYRLRTLNEMLQRNAGETGRIGIQNVNSRIKLSFGEAYGLEVSSLEGQYTTVRITLPFAHADELPGED